MAVAEAEIDKDVDLLLLHVRGDCGLVVSDVRPALRDQYAAIGNLARLGLEGDSGRAGCAEQTAPIGVAAMPRAFDQIVLGDVLGRGARLGVALRADHS